MDPTASVPDQLRSRIRKYFLVVFAMIGGAIVLLIGLGATIKVLGVDSKTAGAVLGIVAPIAMLSVVVGSWVAVSKLWRCPKCDASVYWAVSWNMSVNVNGKIVEEFLHERRAVD